VVLSIGERIAAIGAAAAHDLDSYINHAAMTPMPGEPVSDGRHGCPSDAIAVGPHAREIGLRSIHEVQVVEAGDAHILRHADASLDAFEQYAQGKIVIVAEHSI
jgi:hypothetical protein